MSKKRKMGAWAAKRKVEAMAKAQNTNARGARAVRRKNKAIEKSYSTPKPPVPMPIQEIHIDPAIPVKLIVPDDVTVKVERRQTWFEYLFGR